MISGSPMLCSACSRIPTATVIKLLRKTSSGMVYYVRKSSAVIQSLPGRHNLEAIEMINRKRSASALKILGMDIRCELSASLDSLIPSMDSLLQFLSTALGYIIIATSTVTKLPQILKILKHRSVRGLSVASFELEIIGYTIALAYCIHKGLPFSAYGELAFLLIQAIILIAIIYYYSPPMGTKTWMKALIYCGLAPTVLAGKIDPGLFEILYASQHAIFFFARVPQIWTNFRNKSTGELSFLTCFMNFAGSLVRVFTSIQEKTPLSGILWFRLEFITSFSMTFLIVYVLVLMGSAIGIVTNGTILGQIMLYQKPVPKKEKKED